MSALARYFLKGLLFAVPIGLTAAACVLVFEKIDNLLDPVQRLFLGQGGKPLPGVGFAVIMLLVLVLGVLASNLLTRRLMRGFERLLERVPMVKLLYTSVRDLLSSFVGDKKRFDKPVEVRLFPGSDAVVLGFVTREDLSALGLPGRVAVYLPQSYNFAGNLILVPRESVRPLEADSGAVMAFVVSGGASLPTSGAAQATPAAAAPSPGPTA